MPSYRYTREIKPEDLQPDKPPELAGKEKARNWWHYHRVWFLVGGIVALLLGFFIWDLASRVQPDYKLGLLAPYDLPEQLRTKLEQGLAAYVDDRNGDGRVAVTVEVYTIADGEQAGVTETDPQAPYTQMAGVVRLSAAFEDGNPILFLAAPEQAGLYQAWYQLYGTEDGRMADEAVPVETLTMAFGDVPGFADMDLAFELFEGEAYDGHQLLDGYRVGLRAYYDTRLENQKDGLALWEYNHEWLARLTAGSPGR